MKLIFKTVSFLLILNINLLFGQTDNQINRERYNFLIDSLSTEKNLLLLNKKALVSEIDSLQNLLVELENKWNSSRKKDLVRKYGKEVGGRILSGQVWKGMSEKMLEDSWGKPDKISKNKEKWGIFSQWFFGKITYFFKDGKMIEWEEK